MMNLVWTRPGDSGSPVKGPSKAKPPAKSVAEDDTMNIETDNWPPEEGLVPLVVGAGQA
jgi:hypothetical protein